MTEKRQGPTLDERDFDAIEAAVMETERGRWFLAEFTRRNRLGETRLLLDAVTRLEQSVGGPRPPEEHDAVRAALGRVGEALGRAARELGSNDDLPSALDGFVRSVGTIEAAVSDIHEAAERVNELAWRLRERGASPSLCTDLERAAADISTASAFRKVTSRRAHALAEAVRDIGHALGTLPGGWRPAVPDARLPGAPSATVPGERDRDVPEPPSPSASSTTLPTPRTAPERPRPPQRLDRPPAPPPPASLAALDELDFRERLKLFT